MSPAGWLARLLDATAAAVVAVDLEGRTLFWNRGAEQLFGWTPDEVLGRGLAIVPEALQQEWQLQMRRVLEVQQSTPAAETQRVTRDGRFVSVLRSAAPLYDEDGQLVGLVDTLTDISAHKQLDEESRALAQVRERELIGMDLHDGLVQSLYGVVLSLAAAERLAGNAISQEPAASSLSDTPGPGSPPAIDSRLSSGDSAEVGAHARPEVPVPAAGAPTGPPTGAAAEPTDTAASAVRGSCEHAAVAPCRKRAGEPDQVHQSRAGEPEPPLRSSLASAAHPPREVGESAASVRTTSPHASPMGTAEAPETGPEVRADVSEPVAGAIGALREARLQLERVIEETRSYLFDLRVREFTPPDLGRGLRLLIDGVRLNSGVQATLELDRSAEALLPPRVWGHVLYLMREAVSNVVRHAGARQVVLRVVREAATAQEAEIGASSDAAGAVVAPASEAAAPGTAPRGSPGATRHGSTRLSAISQATSHQTDSNAQLSGRVSQDEAHIPKRDRAEREPDATDLAARGHVVVSLSDDGCGFAMPSSGGAGHNGVRNMAERARLIGGRLTITSEPGNGTEVRLDIPLP